MEKQLTEATIQPQQLLAELSDLWTRLAREQKGAAGLLRACCMTLLITSEDDADAERARRLVGTVMREHPSRAIVIEIKPGTTPQAHVFVECRKGAGGNDQICTEGIEVVTDAARLGEVARQMAPLVARDLPVMLWCRGASVFSSDLLAPLFPLAWKIIVDSCAAPNAAAAIGVVKKFRGRIADLAWTRITGWREAVAHRVETGPVETAEIRSATIEYSGASAEACTRYLKRWMEGAAPHARVDLNQVEGETGVRGIVLFSANAEIRVSAGEARSSGASDAELMAEELAITGADPVFEDLLERW